MKKVILIVLIGFGLTACCSDTVQSETTTTDGIYVATLYERNCGATTSFVTRENLRSQGARFAGDVGLVFVVSGKPKVNLSWENDSSLVIECVQCSSSHNYKIFKQESDWGSVRISYRFTDL